MTQSQKAFNNEVTTGKVFTHQHDPEEMLTIYCTILQCLLYCLCEGMAFRMLVCRPIELSCGPGDSRGLFWVFLGFVYSLFESFASSLTDRNLRQVRCSDSRMSLTHLRPPSLSIATLHALVSWCKWFHSASQPSILKVETASRRIDSQNRPQHPPINADVKLALSLHLAPAQHRTQEALVPDLPREGLVNEVNSQQVALSAMHTRRCARGPDCNALSDPAVPSPWLMKHKALTSRISLTSSSTTFLKDSALQRSEAMPRKYVTPSCNEDPERLPGKPCMFRTKFGMDGLI